MTALPRRPPNAGKAVAATAGRHVVEDVHLASLWSQRLSWWPRPPRNATGWLPEIGGECGRGGSDAPLPFEVAHKMKQRLRERLTRRLLSLGNSFPLPAGCAPLVRSPKALCDLATCLPNLFLIGTSKSGSTTLYEALVAHRRLTPMFAEPFTHGETHVFTDAHAPRDCLLRALRRSTPLERSVLQREAPSHRPWRLDEARQAPLYVVEYTPHYVVVPAARNRICATLDLGRVDCRTAVKFVAVLRDPARRAFSQYVMKTHMRVARYNDPRTFDEAVAHGVRRTSRYARCWDEGLGNATVRLGPDFPRAKAVALAAPSECAPKNFDPNLFQAYVLKSAYFYQLLPWLATPDDPVANFCLLTIDTFGPAELTRLFGFLDLQASDFRNGETIANLAAARHNTARDGGLSDMSPSQRVLLDDFFRPMNRKLDILVKPLLGGRTTGFPV